MLRKSLFQVEEEEPACKVCVTGVNGYIGSSIAYRLLAAGHTVHGTYRGKGEAPLMKAVEALPGAKDRLKLFMADLTVPNSFDSAVAGCK